jgi:hypothetical protein
MIKMLISRDKKRVTINVDIVPWKENQGIKQKTKPIQDITVIMKYQKG